MRRRLVIAGAITASVAISWNAAAQASGAPAPDASAAAETEPERTSEQPIVVWPTLTPAGDEASSVPIHKPTAGEGAIYARAIELDATLRDAVQDLGFSLDVTDAGPAMGHARDIDMLERAQHASAHA